MTKSTVLISGFDIGVFAVLIQHIRERMEMDAPGLPDEHFLKILDKYFPPTYGLVNLRDALLDVKTQVTALIIEDIGTRTGLPLARGYRDYIKGVLCPSFRDPLVRLGALYAYQVLEPEHDDGICSFMLDCCGFHDVSRFINNYMEQRGLEGSYITNSAGRNARRDAFVASVIGQIQKYEIIPEVMPWDLYRSFADNNPDIFVRPVITEPASYVHEESDEYYSTKEIIDKIKDLEVRRDNYEAGIGDEDDWSAEALGELQFWIELKEFSEDTSGPGLVYNEPGANAEARWRVESTIEDLPPDVLKYVDTDQMITDYIEAANEREIGGVLWFIWK